LIFLSQNLLFFSSHQNSAAIHHLKIKKKEGLS